MKIRVSIANLVWFAVLSGVVCNAIGVRNPKKSEPQFMALGGGAMLTEAGKKMLEESFGASDFEFDEKSGFYDARFKVDEQHLDALFVIFSGDTNLWEKDRTLDIRAELTEKEFGGSPLLSAREMEQIKIVPMLTVRQAPAEKGADTSSRASADVETRRLFRIFALYISETEVYEKFMASPFVRKLSEEERASTKGGSCAGKTSDGFLIQNNLFRLK